MPLSTKTNKVGKNNKIAITFTLVKFQTNKEFFFTNYDRV